MSWLKMSTLGGSFNMWVANSYSDRDQGLKQADLPYKHLK